MSILKAIEYGSLHMTGALAQAAPQAGRSVMTTVQDMAYLVASILFILGIKRLRSPKTARDGNTIAAAGMALAIVATLLTASVSSLVGMAIAALLGSAIGAVMAARVQMTQMPQMVALFNGFGGIASALVAGGEWASERASAAGQQAAPAVDAAVTHATTSASTSVETQVMIGLSILIGMVAFTGSLVAAGKLNGNISGKPIVLPAQLALNVALLVGSLVGIGLFAALGGPMWALALTVALSAILGVTLTVPIGGADMPVMVSLLNSYSGLAAAATGFIIFNKALIVSGALVGASGLILTVIMCKAMNRSLANVLFAGIGTADSTGAASTTESATGKPVKRADADDTAIILDSAQRVMFVPGYGLAVAQAQHALRELADELTRRGVKVMYGVHPVAGRMPGHMNVLLAEADVPYEQLLDIDQANAEIEQCDVAMVIGANDVVNPATRHDQSSPIFGMPIIDVDKAQTVFVLKRSMAAGYAGVDNELFVADNTLMVFGDAKDTLQKVLAAIKEL